MGLSIWHIGLFAIVVLLLFGTSKLKNLGKDLGGAIKDFKDSLATEDKENALEAQPRLHQNHLQQNHLQQSQLKDIHPLDLNKEKSNS